MRLIGIGYAPILSFLHRTGPRYEQPQAERAEQQQSYGGLQACLPSNPAGRVKPGQA